MVRGRRHPGVVMDQAEDKSTEGTVWLAMGARRHGALRVLSEEVSGVVGALGGSGSLVLGEG